MDYLTVLLPVSAGWVLSQLGTALQARRERAHRRDLEKGPLYEDLFRLAERLPRRVRNHCEWIRGDVAEALLDVGDPQLRWRRVRSIFEDGESLRETSPRLNHLAPDQVIAAVEKLIGHASLAALACESSYSAWTVREDDKRSEVPGDEGPELRSILAAVEQAANDLRVAIRRDLGFT